MICNLWVKDCLNGRIHQIGTDKHDSLLLVDGKVQYRNLQNGGMTGFDYEFCEAPDLDSYINVTPEFLYLNRQLIQKDILRIIDKNK